MTYAVLQDLIDRYGEEELMQLTDRATRPEAAIGQDPVIRALEDADRRINGYLGVRYAMPLSTVPPIVVGWACVLARYFLHKDGAPDNVVRDYRDAVAELKDAAAGRLSVPDLDGLQPAQSSQGGILSEGSGGVFDKDNLGGWL